MEAFFNWLATPGGMELEHALVVLLVAIAGYLNWLTHQEVQTTKRLLNGHLEQHLIDATTSSTVPNDVGHNI